MGWVGEKMEIETQGGGGGGGLNKFQGTINILISWDKSKYGRGLRNRQQRW